MYNTTYVTSIIQWIIQIRIYGNLISTLYIDMNMNYLLSLKY